VFFIEQMLKRVARSVSAMMLAASSINSLIRATCSRRVSRAASSRNSAVLPSARAKSRLRRSMAGPLMFLLRVIAKIERAISRRTSLSRHSLVLMALTIHSYEWSSSDSSTRWAAFRCHLKCGSSWGLLILLLVDDFQSYTGFGSGSLTSKGPRGLSSQTRRELRLSR
jgi:hypothetical protein